MKILFMGTPEFAVMPLQRLVQEGHEVVGVITQPDRPKNRGKKRQPTPVKEAAEALGLEVLQPERLRTDTDVWQYLREKEADVGVVAAYGQLLPPEVLSIPRWGWVNIHASLLPKLRGAAPIQRAILEGYLYSGVTLMKVAEGLDTGDMLAKKIVSISGMTAGALHDELMVMGADMIVEWIRTLEQQGEDALKGEPQNEAMATYAPMIEKSEGKIDFSETADEVFLRIQAMDPWPGAYTYYQGKMMKIRDPEWYGSSFEEKSVGKIMEVSPKGMVVQCRDSLILIHTIQFPGKRAMDVEEFIKGNELTCGVILGQEA